MASQGDVSTEPLDDKDWLAFFRDSYLGFGPPDDLVLRCVRRAYRDFNRTWHGAVNPAGRRPERRAATETAIVHALNKIAGSAVDQAKFDGWHSRARAAVLCASDPRKEGDGLTLGQAQKWLNMSVKYVVGGRIPGYCRLEAFAHVPIDRLLLTALSQIPAFAHVVALLPPNAWSKLSDEQAYIAFQREVRRLAAPAPPLALEFRLWLGAQVSNVTIQMMSQTT